MSKIKSTRLGGARVSPQLDSYIKRVGNAKPPLLQRILGKEG